MSVQRLRGLSEPVSIRRIVYAPGAGSGLVLCDADGKEVPCLLFSPAVVEGAGKNRPDHKRRGRWCLDPGKDQVFLPARSRAERLLLSLLREAEPDEQCEHPDPQVVRVLRDELLVRFRQLNKD